MSRRRLGPSPWLLAVASFVAVYWIADLAVLRAGPPHPLDDIWEDGVAARQLLAGRGFRTTMIYPPLWGLRDPATLTVPLLVHGPLLPLALALPLRLAGPGLLDHLAWVAAVLASITAYQVFRLAARWFGESVGAAAALLLTVSPILLDAVHHSLSVVVGGNLLLLAVDLAVREAPRPLLAGFSLGLGYWVRPELLLAAPILAGLAGLRGTSRAARLALGFAAPAGAWWWHQWAVSGMPLFNLSSYTLLGSTNAHPGHSVMRDFDLPSDRWPAALHAELPGLWRKWVAFSPRAARHAATALGATLGWLAPVGAWAMLRTRERRGPAMAGTLIALIPVATMTLALPVKLYLVPCLGLYAVAAARGAEWLLAQRGLLPGDPRRWVAALGLVAALSSVPALLRVAREGRLAATLLAAERSGLESAAAEAKGPRLMFSDRPDFVAWTTGRATLWMEREEYQRLYPPDGAADTLRRYGLPAGRDPAATWFHDGYWAPGRREP